MCNCGKEDKYYSPGARQGIYPWVCYLCELKQCELKQRELEQDPSYATIKRYGVPKTN